MPDPRPHLLKLAPYILPDTSAPEGKRQLQLAQNESALGPSLQALAAAQDALLTGRLYPDSDFTALRTAIAEIYDLTPTQILCGCGSIELIALLTAAYLRPGDRVVTSQYSYLFFRTASKVADAQIIAVPEPTLTVEVDALLAAIQPDTRIVFVANPGNPSGTFIPRAELVKLRQNLPDDILLIIDEAYAEYVPEAQYEPLFDLVALGNTVILRTFSKIYGLAGLRVGWGYFPPDILDILRRIQMPSSISLIAQAAATAAVRDQQFIAQVRQETAEVREWFTQALADLGLNPQPSLGNFVLCRLPSSEAAFDLSENLRAEGIVVRVMKGYDLPNCIRITLGTRDQMEDVVAALQQYCD
ncbi:MAG: histidinol-phosphate transaminase [Chloroflexota bacterium]